MLAPRCWRPRIRSRRPGTPPCVRVVRRMCPLRARYARLRGTREQIEEVGFYSQVWLYPTQKTVPTTASSSIPAGRRRRGFTRGNGRLRPHRARCAFRCRKLDLGAIAPRGRQLDPLDRCAAADHCLLEHLREPAISWLEPYLPVVCLLITIELEAVSEACYVEREQCRQHFERSRSAGRSADERCVSRSPSRTVMPLALSTISDAKGRVVRHRMPCSRASRKSPFEIRRPIEPCR